MLEWQRNLYVLRRWWWLLVAAAVAGGVVAFLLTKILVAQQYQATTLISLAPPPAGPNGLSVTALQASADAQLVPTLSTAQSALQRMPGGAASHVKAVDLARDTAATASIDNQVLTVDVRWTDSHLAPRLSNAMAEAFIAGERTRLESRYHIMHSVLLRQQRHLAHLVSASSSGPAFNWLQGQYADAAARLYQEDADARIQASMQENGLTLSQPASTVIAVGPRATVNALIGAALAFIVALIFAFAATSSYGQPEENRPSHPVLAKVGE